MNKAPKRKVVAIDGLAATGKTTLARELAKKLDYYCLQTGFLYRAVAFLVLQSGLKEGELPKIIKVLNEHQILPIDGRSGAGVLIDGKEYCEELRSAEVSEMTSKLSVYPEVRDAIFNLQREAFPEKDIVAEGRDMGTVVFPDAEVKFFIIVSPEVRARRRLAEFVQNHPECTQEQAKLLEKELKIEIEERDDRDANRSVSPAIPAKDAIIVDNSAETLTEVIQKMYVSSAKNLGLEQAAQS